MSKWLLVGAIALTRMESALAQTVDPALAADIDAFANRIMALQVTPGLAIAVVKGSDPVLIKGYGFADIERQLPVTANTGFYVASVTKSFTALTINMLEQRGLLKLDDPLSKHLRGVQLGSGLNADSITIRQLLTHSHGISGEGPIVYRTAFSGEQTNTQILQLMRELKASDAGRNYRYTNLGYNIAGLIVDEIAHGSWKNVMQVEVLNPLGMNSTRARTSSYDSAHLAMPYTVTGAGKFVRVHYSKGDDNMQAAGGLISTANDMAKWLEVQMNRGMLDGKQIFPASVIDETHRNHVATEGGRRDMPQHGYGLGWSLNTYNGAQVIQHGGGFSEFRANVAFAPERKIGVAVLTNSSKLGGALPELITQYVFDRVTDTPGQEQKYEELFIRLGGMLEEAKQRIAQDAARRAARPQTLSFPLTAFAGTYQSPLLGTFIWEVRDDKLHARAGVLRATAEVFDHTTNKLRVEMEPGTGEVVEFKFVDGTAASMIYRGAEYKRIR